jgi:hypothetical protein
VKQHVRTALTILIVLLFKGQAIPLEAQALKSSRQLFSDMVSSHEKEKQKFDKEFSTDERLPGTIDKQFLGDAQLVLDACERMADKLDGPESKINNAKDEVDRLLNPFSRRPDAQYKQSSQLLLVNLVLHYRMLLSEASGVAMMARHEHNFTAVLETQRWLQEQMKWTRGYAENLGNKYSDAGHPRAVGQPAPKHSK